MWSEGGRGGEAVALPCSPQRLPGSPQASLDSITTACLSVCLSGLVLQTDGGDGNRAVRRVQRTRHIANLPGHLARLMLFKQVPRWFVSRLVKCLTF